MKKKRKVTNTKGMGKSPDTPSTEVEKTEFPGYPRYPAVEDIYIQYKEEMDIDPERPSQMKVPLEIEDRRKKKDFEDEPYGGDLDIPGAELDDDMEDIGSEDEENNYYSLGGENHNDLEEN
ncbi:hypothetical protein P872_19775 [Rhodonellum psychrophilum GCM71 = DSM 17998]|uniref:Uncharacterized protein n=2 Tax=Rhodonellum TaxID=336827 RepID=U5C0F0_9BACT|nr:MULTISPECIES: hypothetical protein [Rhodonellum]ERM81662.1 hypothetical protein P872_19775 [Rhodonellum psychrophilum GCM71 = DSM 17998]SDZ39204.1 hypothetical protein SAMN05444412_11299 [Rhodonellum ikkaensis]